MSMASSLILAWMVTVQVFREGPITMHRVLGAVGVYLLLGLAWSFAYHLLDVVNPEAFSISGGSSAHVLSASEFLYFSFVTLTTVGFGDITPLDPAARSVVMVEALTGQLFPAILIARLVSMELVSRTR
jgi:voltage-gated potassium channel Kch